MPSVAISYRTLPDIQWISASGEPIDPARSLALFRIGLPRFSAFLPDLEKLLHPDEIARAQRYHQEKDRQRFIIVRGLLRCLLGQLTALSPTALTFSIGSTKKPGINGFPNLHYNVSHSGDWALIAIAHQAVGVDVEQLNPQFPFADVISHSFHPQEQLYLRQSTDPGPLFYQLWTRKEALLKATGKGISDDFFQLPARDGTHLVDSRLVGSLDNWTVSSFAVTDDYPAAVAHQTKSTVQNLKFYTVDPEWFS